MSKINKMDKKELILLKLTALQDIYKGDNDKKWNLRAISIAINSIKKYDGDIISGSQMEKDLKGIGNKIAKRIDEILETGDLNELSLYKVNYIDNLLNITGVGNVRAKKWLEMDIKTIDDVIKAKNDKLIDTTHHIDIGIKYYYDLMEKIPRSEIDEIKIIIGDNLKLINKDLIYDICGSYRRGTSYSGDIDILITNPKFIENISKNNYLEKIVKKLKEINFIVDSLTDKGDTKYMGICKLTDKSKARRIDIRVIDYQSYYVALLYFTGNKNFNIYIRKEALKHNYSLNEYGMIDTRDNSIIFMKSEEEIFKKLNIPYLKPEERDTY